VPHVYSSRTLDMPIEIRLIWKTGFSSPSFASLECSSDSASSGGLLDRGEMNVFVVRELNREWSTAGFREMEAYCEQTGSPRSIEFGVPYWKTSGMVIVWQVL
jgi:hypothetical protein